ncbi:MAG TPA: hypothetical protein VEI95_08445, partial [Acidobacteriota bacterium]|nr:hypothetical protein [Acidobacteriota bacterium]
MAQLKFHALWDSLLICVPPMLALLYVAFLLARTAWIGQMVALTTILAVLALGVVGVILFYRPVIPKLFTAAQLLDKQSGAKEHFLTLATVDPSHASTPLLSRLRAQTAELVARVELKRDFPYKLKRSAYWSMGGSLIVMLLLQFFLPVVEPALYPLTPSQRLRTLAEKMAYQGRLQALSQELQALVAKLEDAKIESDEKQAAIQELEKKIQQQQRKEEEKDNRDLLGQTANALKGAEQQQSAKGQERQKDQSNGGGNLQSNLPQEGQSEGKQSDGGGKDGNREMSTQLSKDMQQGKSAPGNPKESGQEKNQQQLGDTKGNQPDPNQSGLDQNKNKTDKNQAGTKEGAGKNQASEEPPQGTPPSDRFYKAGESRDGLKNSRYVTVQLPE